MGSKNPDRGTITITTDAPERTPLLRISVGVVCIALVVSVLKACVLSHLLTGSLSKQLIFSLDIFLGDSGVWLLLLGVAAIVTLITLPPLKFFLSILAGAIVLTYVCESIIALEIFSMPTWDYIRRVIPEVATWFSFVSWTHATALVGLLALSRVKLSLQRTPVVLVMWISILLFSGYCFVFGGGKRETRTSLYRTKIFDALHEVLEPPQVFMSEYTPEETAVRLADYSPPTFTIPENSPSIILLVVESLSSIDIEKISGVKGMLPRINALASRGMLFVNFFANGIFSELGLAALFTGFPPIPYPGNTGNAHIDYALPSPILSRYKDAGYNLTFLTTGRLDFFSQGELARGVGFDVVDGLSTVAAFQDKPTFALRAPSDEVLYGEALSRIDAFQRERKKFLISLITTSSHLPWIDPRTGERREESVWEYVDSQVETFVSELERRNFFEKGLLLITGDHRKPLPLSDQEVSLFGDSAIARIPLIAIGQGIHPQTINPVMLQQTELLTHALTLPSLMTAPSSEVVLYNPNADLAGGGGRGDLEPTIWIFQRERVGFKRYLLVPEGRELRWYGDEPPTASTLLHSLHQQRALLQSFAKSVPSRCPTTLSGKVLAPRPVRGLSAIIYNGTNLHEIESLEPFDPGFYSRVSTIGENEAIGQLSLPKSQFSLSLAGHLTFPGPGQYDLRLDSDDGACLYIQSRLIIDAAAPRRFNRGVSIATVEINEPEVPLEVLYMQEYGLTALILYWRKHGDQTWEVVPPTAYSRQ